MRVLFHVVAAVAVVYGADWAYLGLHPSFETVHVERFNTIHEKFNKVSYEPAEAHDERCVHALFPHAGNSPCWYLKRHRTEIIE